MLAPVCISAVIAACLVCAAPAAAAKQIRIALQHPPTGAVYENLVRFEALVEKGTNGALDIVIAHSGQLIKEQDAPEAVGSGAVEMSAVTVNQYSRAVPAADIFVEPFMFAFPPALAAATRPGSPVRSLIDRAILDKTGVRVLWWQSQGVTIMVSKGEPLRTPAAIVGRKVRVSTDSEAEFVNLCGGIAIIIPAAEQYNAYKTGQVDAGSIALIAAGTRKLWEVMSVVTYTRHRTSEFVVTINERLWQSLRAEHRDVLRNAAHEAERAAQEQLDANERAAHALCERNGMKMVELTQAEFHEWKACATPMLEAYLKRSGPLGARVMEGYRRVLVEAYRTPAAKGRPTPSR